MTKAMPIGAQKSAVRAILVGASGATFEDKLTGIEREYPELADGIKAVREEGETPKPAGSGSAAHASLNLTDCI